VQPTKQLLVQIGELRLQLGEVAAIEGSHRSIDRRHVHDARDKHMSEAVERDANAPQGQPGPLSRRELTHRRKEPRQSIAHLGLRLATSWLRPRHMWSRIQACHLPAEIEREASTGGGTSGGGRRRA